MGGKGAVRIIWGPNRVFPSTNTEDIYDPPSVTSSCSVVAGSDTFFTYQIETNNPTTSYAASGLPAGLALNASTGVISGMVNVLGSYEVMLTATNSAGTGPAVTLVITVRPPSTAKVTTGGVYSLASLDNGTVTSWGSNYWGHLGDGTTTDRQAPVAVSGPTGVIAVAGGLSHSLALTSEGRLWSWGRNLHGELANGSTISTITPALTSVTGAVAVAACDYHTLVVKSDGTVWGWGNNAAGALGNGSTAATNTQAVQMSGITGAVAVATSWWHTVVLKGDGTVWTCGKNTYGALGDGTTTDRLTPVQVSGLTGVVAVTAGYSHTVALKSNGTVWAWGQNSYGELGDGTTTNRSTPVQVSGLTGVVAVASSATHTVALKSDGRVWAWGQNSYGQLGDGTTTNRSTPVQVSGLANIVSIAAGYHNLAVCVDGAIRGWGRNDYGQVGDGTTTHRYTPVEITLPPPPTFTKLGGDNQVMPAGALNAQPFDLAVWNTEGTAPLVDTPVAFTVQSGGGQLAETNVGNPVLSSTITLTTDEDGTVQAYYKQPVVLGVTSVIRAMAGTGEVEFLTQTSVPLDADEDGLLDSWEMEHFGVLLHGADDDPDFDGLTNAEELAQGKDPLVVDSPGGTMPSGGYSLVIKLPNGTFRAINTSTWEISPVPGP